MPVVLTRHASWPEVLWNFSRFKAEKRLTLKQSPHFYELLPTSPEKYGGGFTMDPIKTFQHQKISVLVDNPGPGRVFLETAKETRVFRNAWVPKDAIIFKGPCPYLMGFSPSLTPCQTSMEGLKVKALSGQPSEINPTYGVIKSESLSTPFVLLNRRFRPIEVSHHPT